MLALEDLSVSGVAPRPLSARLAHVSPRLYVSRALARRGPPLKMTRVEATTHNVPVPLLDVPVMRSFVLRAVETDGSITGYGISALTQEPAAEDTPQHHSARIAG